MNEKERDTLDDLFRSKLYDLEADTMPDDWEAIAGRLPGKTVSFRRTLRYWAAAAVVSLLMITGSVYLYKQDGTPVQVADVIHEKTKAAGNKQTEEKTEEVFVLKPDVPVTEAAVASAAPVKKVKKAMSRKAAPAVYRLPDANEAVMIVSEEQSVPAGEVVSSDRTVADVENAAPIEETVLSVDEPEPDFTAEASVVKEKPVRTRRWNFGMGGGSVTAGTSSSINAYTLKNTSIIDNELMFLNSPYFDRQAAKTNVRHKTPVTFGLGVSYRLNDRFSLQSGLNYSLLSSSWETNDAYVYGRETKQKLHFLGIPLSLSYKIAEWNRIQFYAAVGGMAEVNVAGKLKTKIFSNKDKDDFSRQSERIRMNEWMWSVNGRVGASYPLLRFISLYAEVGAGYYFDNGSDIETIRSEKPFNVNLQAGFRFGF